MLLWVVWVKTWGQQVLCWAAIPVKDTHTCSVHVLTRPSAAALMVLVKVWGQQGSCWAAMPMRCTYTCSPRVLSYLR